MNPLQKILVVDDEEVNLTIISNILENQYLLETARSGKEALKKMESFKPEIVLLDIMLPGMDGYEVCKKIRDNKGMEGVKILLVSAKGLLDDRLKGYDVGADDYIQKPFDEQELVSKIKVFVRLNKEEAQRKQLNRLLLLRQQDIPNILWECNTDFCFSFVDNNITDILGYSADDVLGKPISDLLIGKKDEFDFKFKKQVEQPRPEIRALPLTFTKKDGTVIELQIYADGIFDDNQTLIGFGGIFRDISMFTNLITHESGEDEKMTIRLDKMSKLIFIAEDAQKLVNLPKNPNGDAPDMSNYYSNPETENLIQFAFSQQEDVPFSIELELPDIDGVPLCYSVDLKYHADGPFLEGELVPSSTNAQLNLVSTRIEKQRKKIKDQEETLKHSVIIDADVQQSILEDAGNLSAEILNLIKTLEPYSFSDDNVFILEDFEQFICNRNLHIYSENLRLLGNKIHGLKGSCGFLIPTAKQLCHQMEEITKPLTEQRLVYTNTIARLLKQFIFKIDDMLEQFQIDPNADMQVKDWLEKIDLALNKGIKFIGDKIAEFKHVITQRNADIGEIRKRQEDNYLSVSQQGYESLAEQAKELYYLLSGSLSDEQRVLSGNLFNQFLSTHQQIKKVPLNLSRYERMIPKLARDYGKKVDFHFIDHHVKADREFWDVIHEILNHVLKNAVIHGIETCEERVRQGKEATGIITVELKEDAIHILLSISDNGRGIDLKQIAERAITNGTVTQDKVNLMSEQEILDLLFLQGVSTANDLDDNAGRGVGMNAVLEAVKQLRGDYRINNRPDQGCNWNLSFMKDNVSLPCIIVAIGDFILAIPENFVETFIDFNKTKSLTINRKPAYPYNGKPVSLIDSQTLFSGISTQGDKKHLSLMILTNKTEKKGLIINQILHHAVQPILPLPKLYRNTPIYQGITIFNNDPVQVINVEKMF